MKSAISYHRHPVPQAKLQPPQNGENRPLLIGTVHTRGGMKVAATLSRRHLDAVEIRLDAFARPPTAQELTGIRLPKILTPRHPAEGGARRWSDGEREKETIPLLQHAAALDLECAFALQTPGLLQAAMDRKIPLILSSHDFRGTPSSENLRAARDRAFSHGATIFKVACRANGPGDLARLLLFLEESTACSLPVAVMGMGPLGKISRLVFSACGSALVYGWLHRPQVSGQLPALQLRCTLGEYLPRA